MGENLPRRVVVKSVLSSRYEPGTKPIRWEDRRSGIERIIADTGEEVTLYSEGGQSSPDIGWELLLTGKNKDQALVNGNGNASQHNTSAIGLNWTLYGVRTLELPN